jgi:hypothetical protein
MDFFMLLYYFLVILDVLAYKGDGSDNGFYIALAGGGKTDKVDVGACGTGSAVLGSIPALSETVESAHPVAPAVEDANGHVGYVVADDAEVVVIAEQGGEDVGNP